MERLCLSLTLPQDCGGRFRRVVAKRSAPFSEIDGNEVNQSQFNATGSNSSSAPYATAKLSRSSDSFRNPSSLELSKRDAAVSVEIKNASRKRSLEDSSKKIRDDIKHGGSLHHLEQANEDSKINASKNSVSYPGERRSKRLRKAVTKFQEEDPRHFKLSATDVLVTSSSSYAVVQRSSSLMDQLLQQYRRAYGRTARTRKLGVAMTVITQFIRKGGRFLERKYRDSCKPVSNETMLPLVAQALHNGLTSLKRDAGSTKSQLLLPSSKSASSDRVRAGAHKPPGASSRNRASAANAPDKKNVPKLQTQSSSTLIPTALTKRSALGEPNENDVLFGKGATTLTFPGNLFFRALVRRNREHYNQKNVSKAEKQRIARKIIATIESLDPPGRFLEVASDGKLIEALMPRVIDKTLQALRDSRRVWSAEGSERPSFLDYVASAKLTALNTTEKPSPTKAVLHDDGALQSDTLTPGNTQSSELGSKLSAVDASNAIKSENGNSGSSHQDLDDARLSNVDAFPVVEFCPTSDSESTMGTEDSSGSTFEIKRLRKKSAKLVSAKATRVLASGTKKNASQETASSDKASAKRMIPKQKNNASKFKMKQSEHHINKVERVKKLPDGKYPMVSKHKLKLPIGEELEKIGLPATSVGPPRLPSQDGAIVKLPHAHDVLFGRGSITTGHPGNMRFRRIVWENKDTYLKMPRHEKTDFAMDLVNTIRNMDPPGRFLEFEEEKDGYVEPPLRRILDKTLQALRENKYSQQTESWDQEIKVKRKASETGSQDPESRRSSSILTRSVQDATEPGPDDSEFALPPGDDITDKSVAARVRVFARLSVYWPLDKTHYIARILDKQNFDVLLQYEDDDLVEWVDLTRHSFRVIS